MPPIKVFAVLAVAACGHDAPHHSSIDAATQPDTSSGMIDAALTADAPSAASCGSGGDRFVLVGPVAAESENFGLVTAQSKVIGIAGAMPNTDLVSFGLRSALSSDLESVGVHDVAIQNIMELAAPFDTSCDAGNTVCHGFFALAGTVTVTAAHPRYQAMFALTSLFERDDNSSPPGAAIAGTITGCVDKANP